MTAYLTKTLTKDQALGFIQNMRWFAGVGRITARPIKQGAEKGLYKVRARRDTWLQYDFR